MRKTYRLTSEPLQARLKNTNPPPPRRPRRVFGELLCRLLYSGEGFCIRDPCVASHERRRRVLIRSASREGEFLEIESVCMHRSSRNTDRLNVHPRSSLEERHVSDTYLEREREAHLPVVTYRDSSIASVRPLLLPTPAIRPHVGD